MKHEAQLEWERRNGRPAAAAAIGAIVLQVASFIIQAPALQDQPGRDDPDRHSQTLIAFHDHAGQVMASQIVQAVSVFLVAGVLLYLFTATRHRRRELPAFLRWLLLIAPVLVLVGSILNSSDLKRVSDGYIESGGETRLEASPSPRDRQTAEKRCVAARDRSPAAKRDFDKRYPKGLAQCESKRAESIKVDREDDRAEQLIEDERKLLGGGLGFGGTFALAISFVLVSLNAMRAGLLSRFVGIIGVIVGGLMVLPLLPGGSSVIQVFWLGAVGALALNRYPGGRGPAWETGEADPWPTAAERRGLVEPPEPEPQAAPEPEPEAKHPRSKKKKRKRR